MFKHNYLFWVDYPGDEITLQCSHIGAGGLVCIQPYNSVEVQS